jgi:MFS family permease
VKRQVQVPGLASLRSELPENLSRLRKTIGRSGPESIEGLSPEAALHASRNFRLGVLNGVIFSLVDAMIAPGFVLALFINRLGAPNVLVGLLPAILTGGYFLPQILIAGRVQGQRRVMHWYRRTSIVRTACMALLAVATFALAAYPPLLLTAFFVLFTIYAFGGGISSIPWLEIVGKVIPARRRGTFFSLRSFWGGVLALLVSGLVSAILSEQFSGLRFPYNFALLFAISTPLVGAALGAWSSIREPEATVTAQPATVKEVLKRGIEVVRTDRDYRSFLAARVLLALVAISDPFYVVFARTGLGAPVATVGLYLGASAATALVSNFVWGPLADRAGNRTLMTVTAISVALVPLSALAIPLLKGLLPADLVYAGFALVFVFGGFASGSGRIVSNNMMLALSPPAERATYVGFLNTILGLATFVPVLGGALVDTLGFTVLFMVSLAMAALAIMASIRMSTARSV